MSVDYAELRVQFGRPIGSFQAIKHKCADMLLEVESARSAAYAAAWAAAEGSELDIDDAPVRVRCRSCGSESSASANRLLCGACGDWHTELTSGDELLLLNVELSRDV